MNGVLILIFKAYKKILRPLFSGMLYLHPGSCRFYPTCSDYTVEAIEKHGVFKGLAMGVQRILRCHPLSPAGHDAVQKI